jgi:hypothetical protein
MGVLKTAILAFCTEFTEVREDLRMTIPWITTESSMEPPSTV